MKYEELKKLLRTSDAAGLKVCGYIKISKNFLPDKSENERTFIFSYNAISESCFAFDNTVASRGIKLKDVLKEENGKDDGWEIEEAGTVHYQVIQTNDRYYDDISCRGFYNTIFEAHSKILSSMSEKSCKPVAEIINKYNMDTEHIGYDSYSGWVTTSLDGKYFWQILTVLNPHNTHLYI